ncbi:hypothetical protein [Dishui Lake large algae virus 1]|nr:hypothetical protein [Dishui Lake large algae virus 1]
MSTVYQINGKRVSTKSYYISIDSRDRDRNIWPYSSQFEVKLDPPAPYAGAQIQRSFKNVISVELVNAAFPNTNKVLDLQYIYLNIQEIDGILDTTCSGKRFFAKLLPQHAIGHFVYNYQDIGERARKIYPFRGARLDKLTIEFRDPSGALINFGNDNGATPNNLIQTSLTLKIVVEQSNKD